MDKKLVLELTNHLVYYVKTDMINYYITIPKNNNKTKISIELKSKMYNYDIENNDEVWVMENIKNTFSYIDEYNITLVLPILNEAEVNIIEKMDQQKFESIDKLLGITINSAYRNLKENNIDIEPMVMLIDNERYKTFINWFTTRYHQRIECHSLLDLIRIYNVNATSYKKINTPGMTYVVGSYNTEVNAPKIEKPEEAEPVENIKLEPVHSTGFTSYWLLVTITIVVSVIIAVIAFVY